MVVWNGTHFYVQSRAVLLLRYSMLTNLLYHNYVDALFVVLSYLINIHDVLRVGSIPAFMCVVIIHMFYFCLRYHCTASRLNTELTYYPVGPPTQV